MNRGSHARQSNTPSASRPAAWSHVRALASRASGVAALLVVFAMAGPTQADECYGVAEGSRGSRQTSLPCDWQDHQPVEYWRDHYLHYRRDNYYHHPGTPGCVYLGSTCGPGAATAVAGEGAAPAALTLGASYPNPFNSGTTIPVSVAAGGGDVDLVIYNIAGQTVRRVWSGPLSPGEYRLGWDGRDGEGRPVAAGVYVMRLSQGQETRVRKVVRLP